MTAPTSTAPRRRTWRTALHTIHVVASVGLVGAALVLLGLGVSGMRGADPTTVYPAARLVDAWVVAPLAITALATGLLQAAVGRWGLLRHGWLTFKLATTVAAVAVVVFVLEPGLATSASDALAGHTFDARDFVPLVVASSAASALLVVNAALGITKPGRRLHVRTARRTSPRGRPS